MNDVIGGFNIFILNRKIRDKHSEEGGLLKNKQQEKPTNLLTTGLFQYSASFLTHWKNCLLEGWTISL